MEAETRTKTGSGWLWAVLLVAALAAPLWFVHVLDRTLGPTKSDLLPRWVGTQAALEGKDPYSPEVLGRIQTAFYGHPLQAGDAANPEKFLYPATVVLFLAPLARLTWNETRLVYLVVVVPLLAGSLWMTARSSARAAGRFRTLLLVGFALCSWPVMWGLRMQQLSLPVAILLFAALYGLTRGREVAAGILLAAATMKPQMALPVLLWLLVWALAQRRWRLMAAFAGALAAELAATEWLVPGWFGHWRASLGGYSTLATPPLEHWLGGGVGGVLTGALALACAVVVWRLRQSAADSLAFQKATGLVLAMTVCLIPTNLTLIYNYVLLFPALVLLIFGRPRGKAARVVRVLALAQLALDFAVLAAAALSDAVGHLSAYLGFLVFSDYLLPVLVTMALLLEMAPLMRGVGAEMAAPMEAART